MMFKNPFPKPSKFKWKTLNGKVGIIYVITPTDSCIQEGDFMAKVYFRTEKKVFLLKEWDIREEGEK